MRHRLLPLLALIAVALVPPAPAQETLYDVEIVVLQHAEARLEEGERWPDAEEAAPQAPERYLPLSALAEPGAPAPAPGFVRLPQDALQLSAEVERLRSSPRYRVLLHTGWRQPGLPRDEAVAVAIEVPEQPENQPPPPGALPWERPPAKPAPVPAEDRLSGYLTVYLSRFLHLVADLTLIPASSQPAPANSMPGTYDSPAAALPDPGSGPEEAASGLSPDRAVQTPHAPASTAVQFEQPTPVAQPVYHLLESRRLRSEELHYLDHPAFGILARVTPVKASD